jgi:hypothetical protein
MGAVFCGGEPGLPKLMKADISQAAREELTAWTLLATDGLAEEVQERIKREVEAHFCDAVENHLADGLPAKAAEEMALSELGDINTAARGFRKRYVTMEETRWLYKRIGLLRDKPYFFWILGICFFLQSATCTFQINLEESRGHRNGELFFIVTGLVCLAAFLFTGLRLSSMARKPMTGASMWRSWLMCDWATTSFQCLYSATFCGFCMSQPNWSRFIPGPARLGICFFMPPALRLWWWR